MLAWVLNLGFAGGGYIPPASIVGGPAGGRITFDPKRLNETSFRVFDFASQLSTQVYPQEQITSQTVSASLYQGTDPSPATILSGPASVVGSGQVRQLITGGVLGAVYELLCVVATNFGRAIQQVAYLAIIPDLP